jgi:hypothetical protein
MIAHAFLPRGKVIERPKGGGRLVHRTFRNEDGIVLSSSIAFSNDYPGVIIHPRTLSIYERIA